MQKQKTPIFQKVNFPNQGNNLLHCAVDYFNLPFHFHPEIEINLVVRGKGTRYVGYQKENFGAGDLVILGANLPHSWEVDPATNIERSESKHLYINPAIDFFNIPELAEVEQFLKLAQKGIVLKGKTKSKVSKLLVGMDYSSEIDKVETTIRIFNLLLESKEWETINNEAYQHDINLPVSEKLANVMGYVYTHINDREKLRLEVIAEQIDMNPTSFSRLFSQKMGMSMRDYISGLRGR